MSQNGLSVYIHIENVKHIPQRLSMELVHSWWGLTTHAYIIDQNSAVDIFQNQSEHLFEIPSFAVTLQEAQIESYGFCFDFVFGFQVVSELQEAVLCFTDKN